MYRTELLRAVSATALVSLAALASAHAKTIPAITGGGSSATEFDYLDEIGLYNGTAKVKATFSTYWGFSSGAGQKAFLSDDLTCDINAVTGANGGQCSGPAGGKGNTVDYGASDSVLVSAQFASWATSSFGQSAAGDLIQIPSMGTGLALPIVNSKVTANGGLALSDNDLCGVFSGLITNFSQITDTGAALSGAFTVAYRSDSAGATFLLTNHLGAVCTSGNSAPGITFTATTTFATLFPGGTPPGTFIGQKGTNGEASYLAGCSSSGVVANSVGYLSPDYTTIDSASDATISCANGTNEKSPLVTAGVVVGTKSYTPTVANITTALTHVAQGANVTPPTGANETNPALWVPTVQKVSAGYGVVGYSTFDFAQCYADAKIAKAIEVFLKDHYKNSSYEADINRNGLVSLKNTKASTFLTALTNDILSNKGGENANFQNATACHGLVGR